MRRSISHLVSTALTTGAALFLSSAAHAQFGPQNRPMMRGDGPPAKAAPFRIEKKDAGLDALIAPDARLVEVAHGFGINEGVTWVPDGKDGYVLVSGLIDNVVYKMTLDGKVTALIEKAGYSGDDASNTGFQTRSGRAHVLLIGPSCTGLDSQGRILWCAPNDNNLMRLEKDGTRTVIAGPNADGDKHMQGPNDITVLKDDTIYITTNQFGFRNGKVPDGFTEPGVWRLKDGKLSMALSAKDLGAAPNGIIVSPDEKHMYLSAMFKLVQYDIQPDGTLANRKQLAEGDGIIDGMKVDVQGNIYSTGGAGPGVVRISAPDGKLLGLLRMPIDGSEPKRQLCATNLAFGGKDNKTLFIAGCDAVFSVPVKVPGIAQGPRR
ncbi:SMP-30/gluconolactonase/LRE family protein [Sphingobium nicotianae]|uniref:SMP-30/gluconolactonase/LRE family protein n=1 Tax=Sphingobium nicotianae TaxID=2782607 RepID=A0A9X1DE45_9SPHN|nr:SMP-30/gluconolactonase/LRE family protein [Sphingobium nicotianae]MBT2187878.1 SMP-30/gluconolactonase/LRE family protein [Sphingobium nicotianae]